MNLFIFVLDLQNSSKLRCKQLFNIVVFFNRVYYGTESNCQIGNKQVENALIDTSSKPAVIFRIAAKNTKGFGPATQVRWLQGGFL